MIAFWRRLLDLTWFSYRRSGNRTLLQDITIEDDAGNQITINAGTKVDAHFDLDIYELAYTYSLFQDVRIDQAAGIGLYITPIDMVFASPGFSVKRAPGGLRPPCPCWACARISH